MTAKTIFIISDGTGETASIMTRAALVQYMTQEMEIVRCKNVRRPSQVEALIDEAAEKAGFVVYTVVSPTLRDKIRDVAIQKNVPAVDLLGPLLESLDNYFGRTTLAPKAAGLLHDVNEQYFRRIEAMEFTVKHDDGRELKELKNAEIVLLGVSRTSKTPLSIFLSHKGWKVANVPIVLGVPLPTELTEVD
ncbi:MAG: kinase/pyrophosphorylase, partial [Bdellovibrionales bacterium]|nr:kinase/pyrophosphorylase [Bdellovibrionales bacterium]